MRIKRLLPALIVLLGTGLLLLSVSRPPLSMERDLSLPFAVDLPLREALYYAALAPNAHNTQMWIVAVSPDAETLRVVLDEERCLPAVDPERVESYLSMGAFLEYLRRAMIALGYSIEVGVADPQSTNDGTVAVVGYEKREKASPDLPTLMLMERRHTDKRPYQPVEIPGAKLATLLGRYRETLRYYPKGSAEYAYLAGSTIEAMAVQGASPAKRDELARWLRFSDEETLRRRDGLPAEQLGISGLKKSLYYAFVDRERAKGDKFAAQSVSLSRRQTDACSGFFVLLGEPGLRGAIETGMELAAFWLDAAEIGVSLQPLSQMLEEEPFRSEVSTRLGVGGAVRMILRAGIVDEYGSNPKIRRNISDFVFLDDTI